MPNTREKLIEQRLKNGAESICDKCFHGNVCRAIDNQPCIECNQFTDANGVTVQKWIPVTERLPEDDSDVLAYLRIGEEGRIYPANYAKGVWFDCIFNTPATDTTTHWMPLSEPQKE